MIRPWAIRATGGRPPSTVLVVAVLPPTLAQLLGAQADAAKDSAWTEFVAAHSRLLLHVARSVGRDHDAAMDAYAYVIEQLRRDDCRRLRAFDPAGPSQFTTWLVAVARRLCVDHVRTRYGRASGSEGDDSASRAIRRTLEDMVTVELDLTTASERPGPDALAAARERLDVVSGCVSELAAADQLLLQLRFVDDLAAREIAGILGFPTPFHVYRRLNQLFDQLRARLLAHGIDGVGE